MIHIILISAVESVTTWRLLYFLDIFSQSHDSKSAILPLIHFWRQEIVA